MKNISMKWFVLVVILSAFSTSAVYANESVKIIAPPNGAKVSSPVKVWYEGSWS